MPNMKVVFFGSSYAGKSALLKRSYHFDRGYKSDEEVLNLKPTIAIDFQIVELEDELTLYFWDCAGASRFEAPRALSYKNSQLGVFCLDLSKPFNKEHIDSAIKAFHENTPNTTIILVGTKRDLASPSAITLFKNLKLSKAYPIHTQRFITSALLDHDNIDKGSMDLFNQINILIKNMAENHKILCLKNNEDNLINMAFKEKLNRLNPTNPLTEAMKNLHSKLPVLPKKKQHQIIQENIALIEALLNENIQDKSRAILMFQLNCKRVLNGSQPYLKTIAKLIASVVIAASLTILAGITGFGIGFAIGLWTGPGAFISAILAGHLAAIGTVMACAGTGAIAGGLSTYGLFKPSSIATNINNIAASATNACHSTNNEDLCPII